MKISNIRMDEIIPPELDIRNEQGDIDITSLAQSMHEVGLIEPIVVIARDDKFEVVAGHRRYQAAQTLGWDRIEARVLSNKDAAPMTIKIHENIHRKNITVLEEMQIVGWLLHEDKKEIKEIIHILGKGETWVLDRIDMLTWDDETKAALHAGEIKLGVCKELQRVPDSHVRKALIDQAVRGGITITTARQWRIDYALVSIPDPQAMAADIAAGNLPQPVSPQIECFLCTTKVPAGHSHAPNICGQCFTQILREKNSTQ